MLSIIKSDRPQPDDISWAQWVGGSKDNVLKIEIVDKDVNEGGKGHEHRQNSEDCY